MQVLTPIKRKERPHGSNLKGIVSDDTLARIRTVCDQLDYHRVLPIECDSAAQVLKLQASLFESTPRLYSDVVGLTVFVSRWSFAAATPANI